MLAPLLKYFIEVARQGSIRQAAEALHIAPSAINRHILEFEESLGIELFERLPRGMRLTAAGEVLYEVARRMQRDYTVALSEVDLLQQARRGHVSIGTLQALSEHFFPPLISGLIKEYPGITYSFFVGNTRDIIARVKSGDSDIGICGAPEKGERIKQVASVRLPFGVLMPRDHPLAGYPVIRLSDCKGYPLIYTTRGELRTLLDRMNIDGAERVSPALETNSVAMIRELVAAGAGIGFVSSGIMGHLAQGELLFRPLILQGRVSTDLTLIIREERKLSVAASLLLERIEAAFPRFEETLQRVTAP
ncbi:LysR family transcriptional regulator [Variovorax sp. Sphag1AA]|uniref:LysR family transcriptional regulator n=1 Tax=Variovorax sp. Sphag1AA TaxID=2587027 RepID=UPI001614806C|nr:LysR family transcriptional regulator [Variovorax sp. Sphag1AA]MBB3179199.1 DNA-binding transcriptional LysR family regulator [Variovorax sp. Sphag1AA]